MTKKFVISSQVFDTRAEARLALDTAEDLEKTWDARMRGSHNQIYEVEVEEEKCICHVNNYGGIENNPDCPASIHGKPGEDKCYCICHITDRKPDCGCVVFHQDKPEESPELPEELIIGPMFSINRLRSNDSRFLNIAEQFNQLIRYLRVRENRK